jgi:pSer/pThr/pTyr-binding forkhead associated (FHA) protein
MNVEIEVVDGPNAGQVIRVEDGKFLIGRESDCQLRLVSSIVSRHHCVLRRDDYTVRILDLGSMNGTFVNGREVNGEVVLCHGDLMHVGDLMLRISIRDASPSADQAAESTGDEDAAQRTTAMLDGSTVSTPDPSKAPLQDTVFQEPITPPHAIPTPKVPEDAVAPDSPTDLANPVERTGSDTSNEPK